MAAPRTTALIEALARLMEPDASSASDSESSELNMARYQPRQAAPPLCCPYCGTFVSDSRVIDTRLENNGYRRRQCMNEACDSRFTTREVVVPSVTPKHVPRLPMAPRLF